VARAPAPRPRDDGGAALESWTAARVASGDLADEIARLKQEPGKDILAHGGASFAASLIAHGLVDEFRLLTHPVVLGRGLPIFSKLAKPLSLQLVEVKPFPGGSVAHIYRPRA
jgi:dihydrofolate reductase